MFTNCEGCTIYKEKAENFSPIWERYVIPDIYWECTQRKVASGKGTQRSNEVFVSIPATSISDYVPESGDTIVKGIIDLDYRDVSVNERYTINSVSDCRYGSPAVQHIEVTAE